MNSIKDFLAKSVILTVVAFFESAVGWPILFGSLALVWSSWDDDRYNIGWLMWAGVVFGLLWQLPLGLATFLLLADRLFLRISASYMLPKPIVNFIAIFSLCALVWLRHGGGISTRLIIYAVISSLLVIFIQRFIAPKLNRRYL